MLKLNPDGKRVVITRALHQVDEVVSLIKGRGWIPLVYPCLALQPPADLAPLRHALNLLAGGNFDWLILTSANTVAVLAEMFGRLAAKVKIAAVGSATAQAAWDIGLTVLTVPKAHTAADLVNALPHLSGASVLLPQSELSDVALARLLVERGAQVTAVPAYTMGIGDGGIDLPAQLRAHKIDAITLASPSAFTNLLIRLKYEGGDSADLHDVVLACIGSTTAQTLQDQGFTPTVTAHIHTIGGMIDALAAYFTAQETPHS